MSKYDIFGKDYDGLASDRLIENAEDMLNLLKDIIAATYEQDGHHWPTIDFDDLIDTAKRITNHIETGE